MILVVGLLDLDSVILILWYPDIILIRIKFFEILGPGDNTAWSNRVFYQLITELVVAKQMSHDVIMMIHFFILTKSALDSTFSI